MNFRRHLTYANTASLLAIIAATGGTALAAVTEHRDARAGKAVAKKPALTGTKFKNGSITAADVRNSSLEIADLAPTSVTAMRGRKGATGEVGARGDSGPQGPIGDAGAVGPSAHSLVRYATYTSEYIRSRPEGETANPATSVDWDHQNYPSYVSGVPQFVNFTRDFSDENHFQVEINENEPVLVQLTGNNHVTTGTIRPTSQGLLTASATITILHSNHAEANFTGGLALHGRVRCALRYANNGEAVGAGSPQLGASQWISSRKRHKLYTITMTGSALVPADSSANYNVGVSCRDVDRTGANQWTFTSGHVAAHAVYVES